MPIDSRGYSFGGIIKRVAQEQANKINVMVPARVESYDPEAQTVDAQPLPKVMTAGGTIEEMQEYPVIMGCRVQWPRTDSGDDTGPKAVMYMPIVKGTIVQLIFSDYSLDQWANAADQGLPFSPQDAMRHGISTPTATPGIFPSNRLVANNDQSAKGSGAPIVDPSDIRIVLEWPERQIKSEIIIGGDTGDVKIIPSPKGKVRLGSDTASSPTVPQPALKEWLTAFKDLVALLTTALETIPDGGGAANVYPAGTFDTLRADLDQLISDFDSDDPTSYGVVNGKVVI